MSTTQKKPKKVDTMTIRISKKTKRELDEIGKKTDTYNDIIIALLKWKHYKERNKYLEQYVHKLEKEGERKMNEVDELLLDVLNQACGNGEGEIDNQCISTYEEACDYLKKKEILEEVNQRIFNIKDMGEWGE